LFNKDKIFGAKPEGEREEPRPLNVNVTPALGATSPSRVYTTQADALKLDRMQPEPQKVAESEEEAAGSKLIVGPHIKLKGVEITDCDTLVVEGRVEASMDSRVVQIANGGVFSGTATMDVAEIRGTFNGNLTVRKHLVIYASGRVSGEIRYGKIKIEEGGELSGNVSMLANAGTPAAEPRAEAPVPAEGALRDAPGASAQPLPARTAATVRR